MDAEPNMDVAADAPQREDEECDPRSSLEDVDGERHASDDDSVASRPSLDGEKDTRQDDSVIDGETLDPADQDEEQEHAAATQDPTTTTSVGVETLQSAMVRWPGVPPEKLREHIESLFELDDQYGNGFGREFALIEQESQRFNQQLGEAALEYNRCKNRYANVLPCDDTRVKLPEIEGEAGSTYINANLVRIRGTPGAYLAAQGPLKQTCHAFWRMVWSLNVPVIVMLTRLKENQRYKCSQYWPKTKDQYGEFQVQQLQKIEENDATLRRVFHVVNTLTNEERTVHQLQYVEWPDHGVPPSTQRFRALLRLVDGLASVQDNVVVHCSAGIGRTGTFCAVHTALFQLIQQPGTLINVPALVLALRRERPGMVQTKEQYVFCYMAILEEIEGHPELYCAPA